MKLMYLVILTIMIFSCQNKNKEVPQTNDVELSDVATVSDSTYTSAEQEAPSDANKEKAGNNKPPARVDNVQSPADWTQKIIKTANLHIELKDYHQYNNLVHHSIAPYGAYIAQEQQEEDAAQITNVISIKVPVERFESLVNFLTADRKNKLLQKQITSADVTAEYADTKARLETKKQVRLKYHEFLGNASKVDDMLALQSEINSITEDIEAATARVKSLGYQSAYSTIHLKYFQVLDAKALDDGKPGFFVAAGEALRSGAAVMGEIIVALISAWPLWILLATIWFFAKRYRWLHLRSRPVSKEVK